LWKLTDPDKPYKNGRLNASARTNPFIKLEEVSEIYQLLQSIDHIRPLEAQILLTSGFDNDLRFLTWRAAPAQMLNSVHNATHNLRKLFDEQLVVNPLVIETGFDRVISGILGIPVILASIYSRNRIVPPGLFN
jgi:hypothetical protein